MEDKKVTRILYINEKLIKGETIKKSEIVNQFGVNEKTVRRDLEELRLYFENKVDSEERCTIEYKKESKCYSLTQKDNTQLNREDALAITKILLESRAFCKEEINHLITVVLGQVDSDQRKCIKEIIGNELLNFEPLKHNKHLLNMIWDLSEAIRHKEILNITYVKTDGASAVREVKPVSIIFSEFYFYLVAYISDKEHDSPTVFRIDRIINYKVKGEKFYIVESERFEDGEFRKRVQFMYPGKLMKIKFEYWGTSIDAVLDRLPTARVINRYDNKYLLEAEVYGKGIMMWMLSQGSKIRVLYPLDFVADIIEEARKLVDLYC
jgi:predicted DNA-binding transcriptional regulator YafY